MLAAWSISLGACGAQAQEGGAPGAGGLNTTPRLLHSRSIWSGDVAQPWCQLIYGSTLNSDISRCATVSEASGVFDYVVLTGNTTLTKASNLRSGDSILYRFVQDSTGGRTVSIPTDGSVLVTASSLVGSNLFLTGSSGSVDEYVCVGFGGNPPTWIASSMACRPSGLNFIGVCSQAGVVLARLSGENNAALTSFICGLVVDGLIDSTASMASTGTNPYCGSGSVFDRLGVMAMANSADALLDLCGHTTTLVTHGSPTFTANQGFTGGTDNGTTVFIDTGFNPTSAAGLYTQNSAHIGAWTLTNITSASSNAAFAGIFDGTSSELFGAYRWTNGNTQAKINSGSGMTYSPASAQGDYIVTRTSASSTTVYKNGSSIATGSNASTGVPNLNLGLLGEIDSVTPTMDSGDSNQMSIWHAGGGMTSGQATSFHNRGCTLLTAVSGSC